MKQLATLICPPCHQDNPRKSVEKSEDGARGVCAGGTWVVVRNRNMRFEGALLWWMDRYVRRRVAPRHGRGTEGNGSIEQAWQEVEGGGWRRQA